jgi:hypothetical protein
MEGLDREDAIAHWNTRAALSSLPQEDDLELAEFLRGFSPAAPRDGERERIIKAADRLLQLSRDVDLLREALTKARGWLEHWGGDSGALGCVLEEVDAALPSGISEQGEM